MAQDKDSYGMKPHSFGNQICVRVRDQAEKLKAAIPADERSFTARMFGDPLPQRSALVEWSRKKREAEETKLSRVDLRDFSNDREDSEWKAT